MSKASLELRPTRSLVTEYRRLLVAEPGPGLVHVEQIIELLRRQLATGGLVLVPYWEAHRRPSRGPRHRPYPIPADAPESLREFLESANAWHAEGVA